MSNCAQYHGIIDVLLFHRAGVRGYGHFTDNRPSPCSASARPMLLLCPSSLKKESDRGWWWVGKMVSFEWLLIGGDESVSNSTLLIGYTQNSPCRFSSAADLFFGVSQNTEPPIIGGPLHSTLFVRRRHHSFSHIIIITKSPEDSNHTGPVYFSSREYLIHSKHEQQQLQQHRLPNIYLICYQHRRGILL